MLVCGGGAAPCSKFSSVPFTFEVAGIHFSSELPTLEVACKRRFYVKVLP